jgi:hypothetical protein
MFTYKTVQSQSIKSQGSTVMVLAFFTGILDKWYLSLRFPKINGAGSETKIFCRLLHGQVPRNEGLFVCLGPLILHSASKPPLRCP